MKQISVRQLYNQYKKCPYFEMRYSCFKLWLFKQLVILKAPGKSMAFTFMPEKYYYVQFRVLVEDILKSMKITIKDFMAFKEWESLSE